MSDTHAVEQDVTQGPEQPTSDAPVGDLTFDESTFLRGVRRRSIVRTVLVSTTVVVVTAVCALGGYLSYLTVLQNQSNRIDAYQIELTALTQPNTWVGGSNTDRQFPGARNTYSAFRPVGGRPLRVGAITADFDVWGGEVVKYAGGAQWFESGRTFVGDELAPALSFLYPVSTEDRPAEVQMVRDTRSAFRSRTEESRARLASVPPSATVEVAVSFDRLLTYEQLISLSGGGLTRNWGAVDAWGAADAPVEPMPGNMIGVAFVGPDGQSAGVTGANVEGDLVSDLTFIAEYAPEGTANRCLDTAEYVREEGVRFYGAVFTGSPTAVERLLAHERVDAAVLGFVVEPWE